MRTITCDEDHDKDVDNDDEKMSKMRMLGWGRRFGQMQ